MTFRTTLRMVSRHLALPLVVLAAACGSSASLDAQRPQPPLPAGQGGAPGDTLDPNWVPAGFGSLRQDDIAIKIAPSGGLQVRAVPLDERVLRLLGPDSYRTLSELRASRAREIDAIKERVRLPGYSLWYVSFFSLEQGETRFSPLEFIISNVGRDFRPIDIVPLTPGFGEYRLKQREMQSAIFVFDGQLDINQPLSARIEAAASVTDWGSVLQRIERERTLERSRATAKRDSTRSSDR